MREREKILFYEYFSTKLNQLENEYTQVNNNMSRKSYRNCDEIDFLDLMLIKKKLDSTIQIYYELQTLLNLSEQKTFTGSELSKKQKGCIKEIVK